MLMRCFLLLLFLSTGVNASWGQYKKKFANIFTSIDPKLVKIAQKLNAKIYTDDIHYTDSGVDTFECRRLVWFDGDIGKAIIIKTDFYLPDRSWDFFILAWLEKPTNSDIPMFMEYLIKDVPFEKIEKNIDKFIKTAQEKLKKIKIEDLKPGLWVF
ncbi:MAG: hypothetical protein WKF91_12255 [Segetibacter sp.]